MARGCVVIATTHAQVEAAFQAQTTHVTLSSSTWRLGPEFLKREGDGVCAISLEAKHNEVSGVEWYGFTQHNKRTGRVRRVRRIYAVMNTLAMQSDDR